MTEYGETCRRFTPEEHDHPESLRGDPSQDSRPRVVLFIGDGFSRGLVQALSLQNDIITSPLLPPPTTAHYLPCEDDQFAKRPIWDPEIFPRLWRAWHRVLPTLTDHNLSPSQQFFIQLANRRRVVFRRSKPRSTSFYLGHLGVEIRAYLWHIFRYYDTRIVEALAPLRQLRHWEWEFALPLLARLFRLTIVSFNYDFNIERVLIKLGMPIISPAFDCCYRWTFRGTMTTPILKPHGSINHYSPVWFGGPNPWLWRRVSVEDYHAGWAVEDPFPLVRCPPLPDLVPPGQHEAHLVNHDTDVAEAIRRAVVDCDATVVCGLSAAEPDTAEIERYFSYLNGRRPVIHIGRPGNEQNNAGRLLRHYGRDYRFLSTSDVPYLPSLLAAMPKRSRPKSLEVAVREMTGRSPDELERSRLAKPRETEVEGKLP